MEDYITEILVRLPEKSLCIIKLVSKNWDSFITYDPCFRKIYNSRNNHNRRYRMLGLHYRCDTVRYISHFEPTCDEARNLPRLNHTHQLFKNIVLGSSNGFSLCFQEQQFNPKEQLIYYIYNPITEERFNLPTPKVEPEAQIRSVITAFICKENTNTCLSRPQYYIVIRAVNLRVGLTLTLEVLSSDGDQMQDWKKFKIACSPSIKFPRIHEPGIISNKTGLVYFQAYPENTHPDQPEIYGFEHLIVFNDRQQEPRSIDYILLPPEDFIHCYIRDYNCNCKARYGQTNGFIVYLSYCTVGHYLELWVLDEETKQWGLKYRHLNLKIKNGEFFVLAFHPLDPHLLLIQIDREKTFWFNVERRTMEFNSENPHPVIEFCLPYTYGLVGHHLSSRKNAFIRQESENTPEICNHQLKRQSSLITT